MIREHTDFHLTIGLHEVRASCGERKERADVQLLPFEEEMEELARVLRSDPDVERKGSDLGRRLYEAVFVGPVGELMASHHPGRNEKRGLRLRLELGQEVSGWFWELLRTRGSFLAMSIKTPVVRDMEGDPFPGLRTAWPIRVLVVVPCPSGSPALDADQEVADIRKALGWRESLGLVKVEKLEPPTLIALKKRLDSGLFHVLHFIGHGSLLQGQGALLFEDTNGRCDPVDGARLGGVIGDDESLRLVILNACDSARDTKEDLFSGVAQSLAAKRIPAVIGMQSPVFDDMALAFSRRFYGALARARPVDWAVARGRQEVLAAGRGLDWAIPVLFLSASDGRLFRWRPSWGMLGALLLIPLMLFGYWRWRSEVSVLETVSQPVDAQPCPPVEGLDMEFVWIPAGSFMMGSAGGPKDERPLHEVVISRPFCLGAHEVTQKQWEAFMGPNSVNSDRRGEDLPVASVSWEEVQELLKRVNDRAGRKVVRLATEAEWEYAARGPAGGLPAGFNCRDDQVEDLAPVGSLRPNRWGLHDMQGNVSEWVQDWHGAYPEGPVTDPQGPSSGERRVKRGGSFTNVPRSCRPAARNSAEPDSRRYDVGFRVLRELDAETKKGAGGVQVCCLAPPAEAFGAMPILLDGPGSIFPRSRGTAPKLTSCASRMPVRLSCRAPPSLFFRWKQICPAESLFAEACRVSAPAQPVASLRSRISSSEKKFRPMRRQFGASKIFSEVQKAIWHVKFFRRGLRGNLADPIFFLARWRAIWHVKNFRGGLQGILARCRKIQRSAGRLSRTARPTRSPSRRR